MGLKRGELVPRCLLLQVLHAASWWCNPDLDPLNHRPPQNSPTMRGQGDLLGRLIVENNIADYYIFGV